MTGENVLPRIVLGDGGPAIGIQGLGCMGMSEFYGETNEAEAYATLDRALELGVTMLDTADVYGMGENERLLAPFVKANRDLAVIATKFGYARTPERPDDWSLDNRPEFIRKAADASLERLDLLERQVLGTASGHRSGRNGRTADRTPYGLLWPAAD